MPNVAKHGHPNVPCIPLPSFYVLLPSTTRTACFHGHRSQGKQLQWNPSAWLQVPNKALNCYHLEKIHGQPRLHKRSFTSALQTSRAKVSLKHYQQPERKDLWHIEQTEIFYQHTCWLICFLCTGLWSMIEGNFSSHISCLWKVAIDSRRRNAKEEWTSWEKCTYVTNRDRPRPKAWSCSIVLCSRIVEKAAGTEVYGLQFSKIARCCCGRHIFQPTSFLTVSGKVWLDLQVKVAKAYMFATFMDVRIAFCVAYARTSIATYVESAGLFMKIAKHWQAWWL